jgi:membrane-bound inhibitor of C-type lysozyme
MARPLLKLPLGRRVEEPMESRLHFAMLVAATTLLLMAREAVAAADSPIATAKFACQGGKTIGATFYSNSVELKLSDGRSLKVPQTMSGSGARYANADESFVFWNKGDTAFITEGGGKETYTGCIVGK